MAASGAMTEEEMARAMEISPDDLRSTFKFELTVGAVQRKQAVIHALYKRAMTGDPLAVKTFAFLVPKHSQPAQKASKVIVRQPAQEKPPVIGKKKQAKVDAKTAHQGTGWDKILEDGKAKGLKPAASH